MIIKGGITMLCNVKITQFCARKLSCHRISRLFLVKKKKKKKKR